MGTGTATATESGIGDKGGCRARAALAAATTNGGDVTPTEASSLLSPKCVNPEDDKLHTSSSHVRCAILQSLPLGCNTAVERWSLRITLSDLASVPISSD